MSEVAPPAGLGDRRSDPRSATSWQSLGIPSLALLGFGLWVVGCSPDAAAPWNPAEMNWRVEELGHIAEAYAVVDLCIPMIDSDRDAKHSLVSKIGVPNYASLKRMDTEVELARFLAYHQSEGGSQQQHARLERAYRVAYEEAQPQLRSLDICLETVTDFVNTILNTKLSIAR